MCWTNNPRDMISIQNNLWWFRQSWNDASIPKANFYDGTADGERPYWGWNEIPVDRVTIADKSNWDAVLIKLPAAMKDNGEHDTLDTLTDGAKQQLVTDIDDWVNQGYLDLGKYGKSVVVVREMRDDSGNYFRQFFCQDWSYGKYALV